MATYRLREPRAAEDVCAALETTINHFSSSPRSWRRVESSFRGESLYEETKTVMTELLSERLGMPATDRALTMSEGLVLSVGQQTQCFDFEFVFRSPTLELCRAICRKRLPESAHPLTEFNQQARSAVEIVDLLQEAQQYSKEIPAFVTGYNGLYTRLQLRPIWRALADWILRAPALTAEQMVRQLASQVLRHSRSTSRSWVASWVEICNGFIPCVEQEQELSLMVGASPSETPEDVLGRYYTRQSIDRPELLRVEFRFSLMQTKQLPTPRFVTGFHRSGTTLLADLLGSHPDVSPIYESSLVEILHRQLSKGLSPAFEDDLRTGGYLRTPPELDRGTYIHGPKFLLYPPAFVLEVLKHTSLRHSQGGAEVTCVRDAARLIYEFHCEIHSKSIWVEKTPSAVHSPRLLQHYFSDMRCVIIVRDVRAIVKSPYFDPNSKRLFRPANLEASWFQDVTDSLEFLERYPKLFKLVQYEELMKNPAETLRGILEFLELPWSPSLLGEMIARAQLSWTPPHHSLDGLQPATVQLLRRLGYSP